MVVPVTRGPDSGSAETGPEPPLRRSLFFVPGDDARKQEKSRSCGADTLLLDLEDSVAIDAKDAARERVAAFLAAGDFGGAEPAVRVNPLGTPWFEEDLAAAVASGAAAIMLPKAEDAAGIAEVAAQVEAQARESEAAGATRVAILALVETAAGLLDAATLPPASPRVQALCFGHADFSRDMRLLGDRADRGVLLHARSTLAIAARARGVAPVDTVFLDVRDEAGFRDDARLGLELGFEGKLCIHPLQVGAANDAYTPSPEQIAHAVRVMEAGRQAASEGRGVFTVDGKMVDAPVIEAQQRILQRARRAGVLDGEGGDP